VRGALSPSTYAWERSNDRNSLMSDKSALLVYFVAAAICVAGLIALAKPMLRKFPHLTRPFELRSWKRWWATGFERMRTIPQVWLLLAITVAVQSLVSFIQTERWIHSQGWKTVELSNYPHLSSWTAEIRFLGATLLWGSTKLLPLPVTAPLAVLALLRIARRRGRFPEKSRLGVRTFWVVMGRMSWLLFVASWVIVPFPQLANLVSNRLASLSGFGFFLGLLLTAMFGYGLFLPPLFASLDERIDVRLSTAEGSSAAMFLRLLALQLLVMIASGPGALVVHLMNLVRGPTHFAPRLLEGLDPVWRTTVVPFLLTATLPACASHSLRETMTRTWRWWKQDVLLLFPLALVAGAVSGVASLLLRGLFGLPPRAPAVFAVFSITRAQFELAISVLAFCLLLGIWLEHGLTAKTSLPPETLPEPSG
jgi:hypothetical protein